MRRALAAVLLLGAATVAAPAAAHALSTQVVSCSHLHMTYSYQPAAAGFPITVSGSDCTDGTLSSTSVTGSGTGTFTDPPLPPLDDQCPRGEGIQCVQYALSLTIGGSTVSPVFDTRGHGSTPVDTGLPAFAETDGIVDFTSGHGAGALNSICTSAGASIDCTVDGAFTWVPGT